MPESASLPEKRGGSNAAWRPDNNTTRNCQFAITGEHLASGRERKGKTERKTPLKSRKKRAQSRMLGTIAGGQGKKENWGRGGNPLLLPEKKKKKKERNQKSKRGVGENETGPERNHPPSKNPTQRQYLGGGTLMQTDQTVAGQRGKKLNRRFQKKPANEAWKKKGGRNPGKKKKTAEYLKEAQRGRELPNSVKDDQKRFRTILGKANKRPKEKPIPKREKKNWESGKGALKEGGGTENPKRNRFQKKKEGKRDP